MRRAFLPTLTALSALLFTTIIVLWIFPGSLFLGRHQQILNPAQKQTTVIDRGFFSESGRLGFVNNDFTMTYYGWAHYDETRLKAFSNLILKHNHDFVVGPQRPGDDFWLEHGFGLGMIKGDTGRGDNRRFAFIPHWFALLHTSILPMIYLIRRAIHHRRLRKGLCPTCSYDLRATPPGSRCPECGAIRSASSPSASMPASRLPPVT